MTDEEFQETVLKGVSGVEEQLKPVQKNQETLLKNYDQLSKETKKALEELTLAKASINTLTENMANLKKLNVQLSREASQAGLDPVQRVLNDPRKKGLFNSLIRLSVDKDGDMRRLCEPILKDIGEDTGLGSTLIVAQLFKEIYDVISQYGDYRTLDVVDLGTKVTNFPVQTAIPTSAWLTSEAAAIPLDAADAGSTDTLTVLPIGSLVPVSMQLIEDAEFDVTALMMKNLGNSYAQRLDTAAFLGTGAGGQTDGNFTGMFNSGVAISGAAGSTTVEQLSYDDFVRCTTAVAAEVLKRGPQWWIHPQMFFEALRIKDGNGRPIFQGSLDAPSLAMGKLGTLLGFPVNLVMVGPNTDSAGQPVAAFGDSKNMVVGRRSDFKMESSDHYRWNMYQRVFRGIGRACVGARTTTGHSVLFTSKN
jgi:HK97 family phage major capsid protein